MRSTMFGLGLAAAMAALPAVAHHSFDGTFDRNRVVRLSGTVSEFTFTNPHSYFTLTVTGADGKPESWHVETTSAAGLGARGWTEHSIKPGEALSVDGWAARDGKHYVRLRTMTHADGTAAGLWLPPGPTPLPPP